MTIVYADFINDYPEFSNQVSYPTSAVNYWLTVAQLMLTQPSTGTSFWDNSPVGDPPRSMLDVGTELFIAHNLALEAQAADAASINATPGTVGGSITARTVKGVNIIYDTSGGIEKDAGHWNLTVYGRRFKRLSNLVGAVPLQIGIGVDPTGGANGPGWAGPPPWIIGSPGSGIY